MFGSKGGAYLEFPSPRPAGLEVNATFAKTADGWAVTIEGVRHEFATLAQANDRVTAALAAKRMGINR